MDVKKPNKSDILISLRMFHTELRYKIPGYYMPMNEKFIPFDYGETTDPIIEDLIQEVEEAQSNEQAISFLNTEDNKNDLATILYAIRFNEGAFSVEKWRNTFSIEQPYKILMKCIHKDFKLKSSDFDDFEIPQNIKDEIIHQELINIFNTHDMFNESQGFYKDELYYEVSGLAIVTDKQTEDPEPFAQIVYPEFIISDMDVIRDYSVYVKNELLSKSFYERYQSMDDYFERSKYAKPLINRILNDTLGLQFDEKVALEQISTSYNIRNPYQKTSGEDLSYLRLIPEALEVFRQEQMSLAFKNAEQVDKISDEHSIRNVEEGEEFETLPDLAAAGDFDQGKADKSSQHDDAVGEIDEIICMAMDFDYLDKIREKITDVEKNRPDSQLYCINESVNGFFEYVDDLKDGYEILSGEMLNFLEMALYDLTPFDTDGSLAKLCGQFVCNLEEVFQRYDKKYEGYVFEDIKNFYRDFSISSYNFTDNRRIKSISKKYGIDASLNQHLN